MQTCTGGCYFSFLLYTLRFDGLFTVSSSRGCCPCSCCCCCCFFSSLSRFLNFFWDSFCRVRAEPVLRLYACFFSSRFLRLIVLLLRFLQGNPGLTHPGQLLGSRNGSLKKCIQDDETNMLNMASLAINRYQVSIEFGDQQQSIVIKVVL